MVIVSLKDHCSLLHPIGSPGIVEEGSSVPGVVRMEWGSDSSSLVYATQDDKGRPSKVRSFSSPHLLHDTIVVVAP